MEKEMKGVSALPKVTVKQEVRIMSHENCTGQMGTVVKNENWWLEVECETCHQPAVIDLAALIKPNFNPAELLENFDAWPYMVDELLA